MQAVLVCCPFVPHEWIAAHGLSPIRFVPEGDRAAEGPGAGVCPYAHALAAEAPRQPVAAIALSATCDQLRRAAERMARAPAGALTGSPTGAPTASASAPTVLLHVPHTWETPAARRLYADELQRLGRVLVKLGGRSPASAELRRAMLEHEERRRAERPRPLPPSASAGIRVAVVGGHLCRCHEQVFTELANAGAVVALDATAGGERTRVAAFSRALIEADPFEALVEAYFGQLPDAFRRPNDQLYSWLGRMIAERRIRGLVLFHCTWCDTWRAEAERLQQETGLPLLTLASGESGTLEGHVISRIRSFVEVIR